MKALSSGYPLIVLNFYCTTSSYISNIINDGRFIFPFTTVILGIALIAGILFGGISEAYIDRYYLHRFGSFITVLCGLATIFTKYNQYSTGIELIRGIGLGLVFPIFSTISNDCLKYPSSLAMISGPIGSFGFVIAAFAVLILSSTVS